MAKTGAERQREYRQRKKEKEGAAYYTRECLRVKKYYVPTASLSKRKQAARRAKVRQQVAAYRLSKKPPAVACPPGNRNELISDNAVSSTSDVATPLVVQLPCMSMRAKSRKRISRCVAKHHRQIKQLRNDNAALQRTVKRVSKRYQRLLIKTGGATSETSSQEETSSAPTESEALTPRRKTEQELQDLNLDAATKSRIKRRLLLSNCLHAELQNAKQLNKKKIRCLANVISGKVIKKYRCISGIARQTGFSRASLNCVTSKDVGYRKRQCCHAHLYLREQITEFYERDDNSRCLPGKNDSIKAGNVKVQKRVLNDYLANLFLKYKSEYADSQISLATFCRFRPPHVMLVSFAARNTCLCSKHQNVALKLKALKGLNLISTTSPDAFIKGTNQSELGNLLSQIPQDKITFKAWKKVQDANGRQKTKLVDEEMIKNDFIQAFTNQIADFRDHVHRVQVQYRQLKFLKENLPETHAIVQMDFAENYLCQCLDEIQSAYWNSTMVTLHPTVVYYKKDGVLAHSSFIFVSDTMTHSFGTVYTILQELLPEIIELVPNLSYVHYWTDSPSSQYRNKSAFHFICSHSEEFGMKASWSYFETGHGKGPCDGLGGTAKRMADSAVKQGKCTIQDANDFFVWATGVDSSVVRYIFIGKDDCESNRKKIESFGVKPIKGTMLLHAVFAKDEKTLMTRETSCFCDGCFNGSDGFAAAPSCNWQQKSVVTKPTITEGVVDAGLDSGTGYAEVDAGVVSGTGHAEVEAGVDSGTGHVEVEAGDVSGTGHVEVDAGIDSGTGHVEVDAGVVSGTCHVEVDAGVASETDHLVSSSDMVDDHDPLDVSLKDVSEIGDFVAAIYAYDDKVYYGQIIDMDAKDAYVSFMQSVGKATPKYRWPHDKSSETVWVDRKLILGKMQNPEPTGKSRRLYTFQQDDIERIQEHYKKYLDDQKKVL